jgi:sterol desaturase/sphingolipid hydroxylase (fatty acid hydroxylase superfamily)
MSAALLLKQEPFIRLAFFSGILAIMALWEQRFPTRRLSVSKPLRWGSNLGLAALNTVLLRILFPLAAVGFAGLAAEQEWGLFHVLEAPIWLATVLSVIALDLAVYWQHVMFHALPNLWLLHRVHHADLDFDVTTGLRFHPFEIILSMGIKIAAIALLGASPLAVLLFEILLNGTAMFNHSNVSLPWSFDRWLRWIVVTPDMHRIHHSVIPQETNSNYGFNLSWWDHLFGTYRAHPAKGNKGMTIGLAEYQKTLRVAQLPWILVLPFSKFSSIASPPHGSKTG